MAIPRIIHQTWKSRDVPAQWAAWATSWAAHNPDWEYRLWTDEDCRALVAARYPDLLPVYDAYPYAILRADAARVAILHAFGGVYADLDVECLRPLDPLVDGRRCVAGWEPDEQAEGLGAPRVLCNAVLAAEPGHPFLASLLEAYAADDRPILGHRDVLLATGPLRLTELLDAGVPGADDVTCVASSLLYPYVARTPADRDAWQRSGAFTVHYWANSWVGALAGELHNPTPHDVEGFRFFPGLDSNGHDIGNVGRDVPLAARRCRAMPEAVAFNTDGFVKRALRPRSAWLTYGDPTEQGLYVRAEYVPEPVFRVLLHGGPQPLADRITPSQEP